MRQKSPAELNSKTIRINLDTYRVIRGLSLRDNITMDEALTKLIIAKPKPEHKPVGIPTKPAFTVRAPVALPVTSPIAYRSKAVTAIATNGSKGVAFRIKSKGVRYE
ncbi:hypothetical protein ES708_30338 [subsurface metagenome]